MTLKVRLAPMETTISTTNLHFEANTFSRFKDVVSTFWKITSFCNPEELCLDLLNQGLYGFRQSSIQIKPWNKSLAGGQFVSVTS